MRRNEFSFDVEEAYYIENGISLSYTHRLFGDVDAQVRGSRSRFDYGYTETSPARQDTLDIVGGRVGYNLRNRTRISVNYEYRERRSPQLLERNYDRRRAFLAWKFAYLIMVQLLLSLAVLLAIQASSARARRAAAAGPVTAYIVGPNDVLGIKVLGEADLSTHLRRRCRRHDHDSRSCSACRSAARPSQEIEFALTQAVSTRTGS